MKNHSWLVISMFLIAIPMISSFVYFDNTAALPEGVKLESVDALNEPGTKSGQIKVVNERNIPTAYSWDDTKYTWEKIGQVGGFSPLVSVSV